MTYFGHVLAGEFVGVMDEKLHVGDTITFLARLDGNVALRLLQSERLIFRIARVEQITLAGQVLMRPVVHGHPVVLLRGAENIHWVRGEADDERRAAMLAAHALVTG